MGERRHEIRASSTAARAWRPRSNGRARGRKRGAEPARARVPRREPRRRDARGRAAAAREQAAPRPARRGARRCSWPRSPRAPSRSRSGEPRATRRRRRSRNGSAPRRSPSLASTGRSCLRARASTSTAPSPPAATCSPRCCGAPRRSPCSGRGEPAHAMELTPDGGTLVAGDLAATCSSSMRRPDGGPADATRRSARSPR